MTRQVLGANQVARTYPGHTGESRGFAHFLPTFPQPGGVSATVQGLADVAQQRGRQDVILSYSEGGKSHRQTSMPLASRLLQASPFPVPFWRDDVADRLSALVGLDALILHGVFTTSCSRLSMVAQHRRPELPLIAWPHDGYDAGLFGSKSTLKHAYWSAVERPYLDRADLVVVSTPSQADILRGRGVRTRTLVLPLGLSPDETVAARRTLGARPKRPGERPLRLLSLGRWDIYEKGLDLLCEAAADPSLRRSIAVRLVGPEYGARPPVEALLRRHGLDNFEAVGFVDDIWPELLSADALVMPSRKEGFGLVALQALTSGLPVMISTAAGIAEHVDADDGAVLVGADVAAVRAGLHELVDRRQELSDHAQLASSRLAARFTSNRLMEELLAELHR